MVPTIFYIKGKRTKKSDNKHQGTNHRKPKTNTGPWCSGQHLSQLVSNRRNLILGRKHCCLQKKSHSLFKQNCTYGSLRKSQGKLCKLNSLWVLKQLCCLGKCKVMQPFLFLVSGDFILLIWLRVNAAF